MWETAQANRPVRATVQVPGSKSLTARALVLAAQASGPSRLRGALLSRDSSLMIEALEQLGVECRWEGQDLLVTPGNVPADGELASQPVAINCGLSGTVMRFVPPLAATLNRPVRFDGDAQALKRPMFALLNALRALGASIIYHGEEGFLPFTICGPLSYQPGSLCEVDASSSSQFLSALLLVAPSLSAQMRLRAAGEYPSRPHVLMTLEVLHQWGAKVSEGPTNEWLLQPGRSEGRDYVVEPDLTNAGPFLAAAMLTGGTVKVLHWPRHTTQAGDAWIQLLHQMGGVCELTDEGLSVTGPRFIRPLDANLGQVGELVPTLAGLCAFATDVSHLRAIGHLRGHETDRLEALCTELRRVGVAVEQGADALHIYPSAGAANPPSAITNAPSADTANPPSAGKTAPVAPAVRRFPYTPGARGKYRPALIHTYHDHRLVMLGAQLGLRIGGLRVQNPGTVRKTFPTFTQVWGQMLEGEGNA